jgi:glycosyltransferase involved in cell wall biosynthesis
MQVSVIIPLYNKVRHVQRTIDAVLGQTHGDFELIVVDDGSTDGSADVVRRCADPRVRLVVQENAGVSAARNRGATEAQSELVAFLDADDQWLPDFLETVLRLQDRFPHAAIWATAYSVVGFEGKPLQPAFSGTDVTSPEGGLIDYFRAAYQWTPMNSSTVMIRKNALMEVGGFPVELRCSEDRDTWIRLALRFPIAWSPLPKTVVYQNADNRTADFCYTGVTPYFRRIRQFLREAGPGVSIGEHVYRYLARGHMRLLLGNWLAGDRQAMKTILDDCCGINGVRMRCWVWRWARWIPSSAAVAAWKLRNRLAGHSAELPPFRSIYRIENS